MATSQRRPNKHDIAFFEKNGLRHGEFTLPFGVIEVKVCEVTWNLDSTVLAVWAQDLADREEGQPKRAYGIINRVIPVSHFGSVYPQNHVLDPQKLGASASI